MSDRSSTEEAVEPGASVVLRGVRAGYGRGRRRRVVLDGVELTCRPGRVTGLVGPNGVGKTTLFRLILGFLDPWAGTVRVGGLRPSAWRLGHGIGYLPEHTPRPAGWTPTALFAEGCDLLDLDRSAREEAVAAARERCGLSDRELTTPLDRLSRGQGRRVVLAWALLGDPAVLLLDEPLAGLDPAARAALRTTVAEAAARGATVIVTSHELGEVVRMADRAVVLRAGRVEERIEGLGEAGDPDRLEAAVLRGTDRHGAPDPGDPGDPDAPHGPAGTVPS